MKDLKAQIERGLSAKLKAYGRADKADDKKMMSDHESRMHGIKHRAAGGAIEGMPARGRLDRKSSKGKKDKGKTTVNVLIGQKDDKPPMPMPVPVMDKPAAPPMPPPAPPMPPAGAMPPPPNAGPGGPGGMPMMPMRAAGGRLGMTAGAGSGEGRLEKEALQKKAG